MAIDYFESSNRYTEPVRYFKANDPYYYEVDNIPIKQLEENAKFLKDQIDGLLTNQGRTFLEPGETSTSDLDRNRFNELRPVVDGTGPRVKVMPGRFTARINDAYTKDPLQFIAQVAASNQTFSDPNEYVVGTVKRADVASVLDKWGTKVKENATLMNGLFERTFIYHMRDNDSPGTFANTSDPNAVRNMGTSVLESQTGWPGFIGFLHTYNTDEENVTAFNARFFGSTQDKFRQAGRLESEFIKRWRGVTRTSIVDVPESLEIEIPKFDEGDFFYHDENGNKVQLDANQRIDLLFIYSKPVDASETHVASYSNGSPKLIAKPTLGIVKGAGLGVRRDIGTEPENRVDLQSLEGMPLMIPNSSDELSENTGFNTTSGIIRGSFPSPDDLMNLAPLLAENLSTTSVALIGQSILPVAYVVVKKDASLNSNSQAILTNNDIIDIRPFFRTTELTYNERAGLAAATPQVSLANPVVSEAHLELVKKEIVDDYTNRFNSPTAEKARLVGAGSVKGGMFYGVEGALATYVRDQFNQTTFNGAKAIVEDKYGYAANTIPNNPDWDIARWCEAGTFSGKGTFPNDRVNYFQWGVHGNNANTQDLKYSAFKSKPNSSDLDTEFTSTSNRIPRLGTNNVFQSGSNNTLGNGAHRGITSFYFVEKTIKLNRTELPWLRDYFVSVQLLNCVPLSARADASFSSNQIKNAAGTANIWVDKRKDEFTIFVSWSADDLISFRSSPSNNPWPDSVARNRDDGERYAGFCVLNSDIMTAANPNGTYTGTGTESVTAGVAIYPSVSFQIYGVGEDIRNASRNLLGAANPTLILK